MIRAAIDIAQPAGTYVTPDGRKLYKFAITMKDGTDGLAFAESNKPWWYNHLGALYYEITGVVNGKNHMRIRSSYTSVQTPGRVNNAKNWEWALAQAIQVLPKQKVPPGASYYGDLETVARQLELTLERLNKTTE